MPFSLVSSFRQPRVGMEGVDDLLHELAGGGRVRLRAAGIEEELRVPEARRPFMREHERQRRLPDAAHAAQPGEVRARGGIERAELGEIGVAADEACVEGIGRELVEGAEGGGRVSQLFLQDLRRRRERAHVRQVVHLLQQVGQVPALDFGRAVRECEFLRQAGLAREQEENDEAVEVLAELVFGGLGRRAADLLRRLLVGDLHRDAPGAITKVGGGEVGLHGIEVGEIPSEEGVEEPRHDELERVIGVGEAGARAGLQLAGEEVQPVGDLFGQFFALEGHMRGELRAVMVTSG